MESAYLDIETSWSGRVTIVGVHRPGIGTAQLVSPKITPDAILEAVGGARIVTFNGSCFDLPVIRRELGLDLKARCEHLDLRFFCARHGLKGGLKKVEFLLGVHRDSEGITGLDAMRLWELWRGGDKSALETLLRYNRDDVENLPVIEGKVLSLARAA